MSKQLILSFKNNDTNDSLIIGEYNRELISWIDSWPNWESNGLIIYGPSGSGKTYLSNILSNKSASVVLTEENIYLLQDVINNPICSVVIDDIDLLFAENFLSEVDFLHFFNAHKAAGYYIVANCSDINFVGRIKLPDLASRLLSLPIIQLGIPDRDALFLIISKKFIDKQIIISDHLLKYIASNIPRSFSSVQVFVDWLDNMTLSSRSKINIDLIKEGINGLFYF